MIPVFARFEIISKTLSLMSINKKPCWV